MTGWRRGISILLSAGLMLAGAACAPELSSTLFMTHINYLASDKLEGRGLGSEGADAAAKYIASQFQEAGLRPTGEQSTFFQDFEVTLGHELLGHSSLNVAGAPAMGILYRDYVPFPFSGSASFEGPVAFAGYGISDPENGYDDYADFDAQGKVLLMFRYEPQQADPDQPGKEPQPSRHALFSTKAAQARRYGAKAVLIVNPPEHHGAADRLYHFRTLPQTPSFGIPMLHVTRQFAERLLAAAGADNLLTLQRTLDRYRQPRSEDLSGLVARGDPGLIRIHTRARNVIGAVPGVGPLAEQYIVIGAHYDHLGVRVPRSLKESTDAAERPAPVIHRGADDNASGVAGMLEAARVLAARGVPGRSVLFIAFGAEENGLRGAEYFVDHPTVPIERIVAMINLDMIGRLRDEQVLLGEMRAAPTIRTLFERQARTAEFSLKTVPGGFGPGDHTPFERKGIPAVHVFTGLHEDYHTPGDTPEKINADGAIRITEMLCQCVKELSRTAEKPIFTPVPASQPTTIVLKVRLGIVPSYEQDESPGLEVEGVSAGSPAEKAGLRGGDRIIYVGDRAIATAYDLMNTMSQFEPGDQTVVSVLRRGQIEKVPVTFEAR